jgi:Putative regulator of cell autolysis
MLLNYKQIIWHAIAISLFIAYEILLFSLLQTIPSTLSLYILYSRDILFFVLIGCYYLPIVWLKIPGMLLRLCIILSIIIAYTLCICISGLINQSIKHGTLVSDLSEGSFIASSFRSVYMTTIAIAYSFARYSIAKVKEAYEQKLLKIEAETKMENHFIRSQVNPHLLYNSLSFLYTKTLKEAPEVANTVHLLVSMTEYALANEKENDQVLLEEEVEQMERYVELQQTLHNNRLHVSLNISLPSLNEDIFLPPLLFLNFIENVFKYGNLKDLQNPAMIRFHLDGSRLKFSTRNIVGKFQQTEGKGIGLVNAQARIKKHYGDQSEITIFQVDNIYTVEIGITL